MIDKKLVEKELNNITEGSIVLIETNVENSNELNLTLIKVLTVKDYGFILSASRPYSNLISFYKKNNINTEKLFFLDCVSKSETKNKENISNVLYIENLSDLTHILISIDEIVKKIKSKYIVIDSINTMLIHNKAEVFARFLHSLMTKLRLNLVNGLFISFEDEKNKEIRAEIAQLCDKVIKV